VVFRDRLSSLAMGSWEMKPGGRLKPFDDGNKAKTKKTAFSRTLLFSPSSVRI
jgi:hypothetical protein